MPRRFRVFPLRRLRRFLTIHEPELWEFMAAMAYASPVALFPYTELARRGSRAQHDADAWPWAGGAAPPGVSGAHERLSLAAGHPDHGGPEVWLTRTERRSWRRLSQELSSGPWAGSR